MLKNIVLCDRLLDHDEAKEGDLKEGLMAVRDAGEGSTAKGNAGEGSTQEDSLQRMLNVEKCPRKVQQQGEML